MIPALSTAELLMRNVQPLSVWEITEKSVERKERVIQKAKQETVSEANRINAMHAAGMAYKQIAGALGKPVKAIYKLKYRHPELFED